MIEYAEGVESGSVMARWLAEPMRTTAPLWVALERSTIVLGLAPTAEINPPVPGLPPMAYDKPRIIEGMLRRELEQRRHDHEHGYESYERFTAVRSDSVKRFWRVCDGRGHQVRVESIDEDFGDWDRLLAWPKTPKPTHLVNGKRVRWTPMDPHAETQPMSGGDSGSHYETHKIYQDR